MRTARRLLAAGAALVAARAAHAAGYYVPDLGTVARARGGAYCVAAGDPTAMAYNPAGLIGTAGPDATEGVSGPEGRRGRRMLVDLTGLWMHARFERTGIPEDSVAGSTATNRPPVQIVPALIYVHPVGERWSFAGGFHAPLGPRTRFAADGPQRFTNTELFNSELSYGVAAAYRPHPKVALGLTLEGVMAGVEQDSVATTNLEAPPKESPEYDSPQRLSVIDPFSPTAIVGMTVAPLEWLQLAVSYRPVTHVDAAGTVLDLNSGFEDDVHFRFTLPSILRAGARIVRPRWDVELDVVVEDWSSHEDEVLTADDGVFTGGEGRIVARRDFRSATSWRLGGSVEASTRLRLHAGVYREPSSVPTSTLDVSTVDAPKTALNLGASWKISERHALTGAYTHAFLEAVEVTDSGTRQVSPFPFVPPEALSVVGNGTYEASYDMVGLAYETSF